MVKVVDTGNAIAEPLTQPQKKWSGKCKLCVGCAVFWVVTLAVMIPVSLIKIAPLIGQKAIDMTKFHIKNFTVYGSPALPDEKGFSNGWIHNEMNLESPIFIGAIVHDVNVTMVINQPSDNCTDNCSFAKFDFTSGPIGWFTQPNSTVTQGDNWMTMDVPVHFNSTADDGYRFGLWGFYAWTGGVLYMDLVAEPKLTALGFVTMKTKMIKQIACRCIKDSPNCGLFPPLEKPPLMPNSTFKDDDLYFEPAEDDRTVEPPPFNSSHLYPEDDTYYLPLIELSCEPLEASVYDGTDIMPFVSTPTTTLEFGFAV